MKSGLAIARSVRGGKCSARSVVLKTIAEIRARDPGLNAVTRLLETRAIAEADAVDAQVASGTDPGPLAGVPYGVKDLFDVEGIPTTAGARGMTEPAARDATAISRMRAAGALLVGTLNMDEYAYGFSTVNAHFGTTRNPHDPSRLAGGSSGGSAAAVAAGLLPLALGSDTNGSIRVPASLCGVYGLKPTHAALPMQGVYPFVESFDDIGPFATTAADLEAIWNVLGGRSTTVIAEPRIARLGGWFHDHSGSEAITALDRIATAVGSAPIVELPAAACAHSAAFLMTAFEGGQRHLPALRHDAMRFDLATRDRLLAGALVPSGVYETAQTFRAWFRAEVDRLWDRYDVLLVPSTPCTAPLIDDPFIALAGERVPVRSALGILTQPLSFVGLPVIAAPLLRPSGLPLGIQIVGKPGAEGTLFSLAARLEHAALTGCSTAEAKLAL